MSKLTLAKINLKISHLFWLLAAIVLKFAIPGKKSFTFFADIFDKLMEEVRFYRRIAEVQTEEFQNEYNL